ncbi:MAG: hypothetical protein HC848_08880 [Limnobacter sp.]|nr:hypothetical protein [Limnobacter sp.]
MYQFYPFHIPRQIHRRAALVYSQQETWLFTDSTATLSPWLILHRESATDTTLQFLLQQGHSRNSFGCQLVEHFHLGHDHDRWTADDDEVLLRHIRTGNLKAMTLPTSPHVHQQLLDRHGSYWAAHPPQQTTTPGTLQDTRSQLTFELGTILLSRWQTHDHTSTAFEHQHWVIQRLQELGAIMQGTWQGVSAFFAGLAEMACGILQFAGKVASEISHHALNALLGNYDRIQHDLTKLYHGAIQSAQDLIAAVKTGCTPSRFFPKTHKYATSCFSF